MAPSTFHARPQLDNEQLSCRHEPTARGWRCSSSPQAVDRLEEERRHGDSDKPSPSRSQAPELSWRLEAGRRQCKAQQGRQAARRRKRGRSRRRPDGPDDGVLPGQVAAADGQDHAARGRRSAGRLDQDRQSARQGGRCRGRGEFRTRAAVVFVVEQEHLAV